MNLLNRWITPGAAILCALSLVAAGWALYGWFNAAQQRRSDTARAWHDVVCYIESQVYALPNPPEERARAIALYDHILELVHAKPCDHLAPR